MVFKKGLRPYFIFHDKLELKEACSLKDLINKAYLYINYEEELLVGEVEKGRRERNPRYDGIHKRDNNLRQDDGDKSP